jgi:hypothetical protein
MSFLDISLTLNNESFDKPNTHTQNPNTAWYRLKHTKRPYIINKYHSCGVPLRSGQRQWQVETF